MRTVSSKLFDYNAAEHCFSVDISTLQWSGFPESFFMKSHLTGVEKLFTQQDVIRDNEGEIAMVRYRSYINNAPHDAFVLND